MHDVAVPHLLAEGLSRHFCSPVADRPDRLRLYAPTCSTGLPSWSPRRLLHLVLSLTLVGHRRAVWRAGRRRRGLLDWRRSLRPTPGAPPSASRLPPVSFQPTARQVDCLPVGWECLRGFCRFPCSWLVWRGRCRVSTSELSLRASGARRRPQPWKARDRKKTESQAEWARSIRSWKPALSRAPM